jgi:hypothetical protein
VYRTCNIKKDNKGRNCGIICPRNNTKYSFKGIVMKSRNLKFVFVFLLSIAMVLSVSACGASATEAPAASDAAATDAPVATDVPAAASGDVVPAYVFTNTGSVEICELYLSQTTLNDWGPDQLGGATIPVGQQFTLKNVPAGKYDAKVTGCNGAGESTIVLDIHN